MDTKKLFLKTQMNLINWGLGISFFYILLIVFYFIQIPRTLLSTLSLVMGIALFLAMLVTRVSLKPKAALFAIGALAGQILISLIDTAFRFNQIVETFKAFQGSKFLLFFSLFVGYFIYFLGLFLYYKVYKATRYIKELAQH